MGSVARHDLVVAVAEAGGLGTLSYLPPAPFKRELTRIEDRLGGRTFAANLLMPIISRTHVEACIESSVPVVTLFFGFDQRIVTSLKEAGKTVLFQVGSLKEAERVIASGADGVIVQGHEAGGHVRGSKRLADLLPQIRESFPDQLVCGAGGIHDSASADACRSLGADAVCSGTRFLASPESSAHAVYKGRLVHATETVVTNLFGVGWRDPHRVLPNNATKKWCGPGGKEPFWLPTIHKAARLASHFAGSDGGASMAMRQSLGSPLYTPVTLVEEMDAEMLELVALYAGECVKHIHDIKPAAETVRDLA